MAVIQFEIMAVVAEHKKEHKVLKELRLVGF